MGGRVKSSVVQVLERTEIKKMRKKKEGKEKKKRKGGHTYNTWEAYRLVSIRSSSGTKDAKSFVSCAVVQS